MNEAPKTTSPATGQALIMSEQQENKKTKEVSTSLPVKTAETSSPELPLPLLPIRKNIDDPVLEKFVEFLDTSWPISTVNIHILNLCANSPFAMPSPILWKLPKNMRIESLVYDGVKQRAIIEELWPSLKIIMGDNILNFMWTAGAFTTIVFMGIVSDLDTHVATYGNKTEK